MNSIKKFIKVKQDSEQSISENYDQIVDNLKECKPI